MPEKKLEIGVIGLGKFGLRMATTLVSLGHTVVGIDMSESRVQLAEEALDTVYKADATNISVLRSLHVQDLNWVVISVGQGVEQSLSITLNIQELHGPKIWVKASNEEHRKILQRLRVDRCPGAGNGGRGHGRASAHLSRHAGFDSQIRRHRHSGIARGQVGRQNPGGAQSHATLRRDGHGIRPVGVIPLSSCHRAHRAAQGRYPGGCGPGRQYGRSGTVEGVDAALLCRPTASNFALAANRAPQLCDLIRKQSGCNG